MPLKMHSIHFGDFINNVDQKGRLEKENAKRQTEWNQ